MRKGIGVGRFTINFDLNAIKELQSKGYKYVQIIGLTIDKHYDYINPHFIVLVPIRELPSDQDKKDIYEPIESEILQQWAKETDSCIEIVIATKF